ncbi:hypothetical protein [Phyllobacterium myrsinacearum]|uniref:Uncharacterized protein n=1 Tax=Phyllobacterium myrsinacearum TaxID=28101 RepID=A0A839EWB1_9HYPH|nr:hypothetical protein [Phyllobacterium myrsinacearum]MBA8880697.1 hypothetical protein [Phyllobacterium myrsinacearum]
MSGTPADDQQMKIACQLDNYADDLNFHARKDQSNNAGSLRLFADFSIADGYQARSAGRKRPKPLIVQDTGIAFFNDAS